MISGCLLMAQSRLTLSAYHRCRRFKSICAIFARSHTTSSPPTEMDEQEAKERRVYSIIGEDGFEQLSKTFYSRVLRDPLLGNMYVDGLKLRGEDEHLSTLEPARVRLQEYLVGRFGGPQRYIALHGHPRLRMRHRHFVIDQSGRDRWMELMKESLAEMSFPAEATQPMLSFFENMSTHMINAQ